MKKIQLIAKLLLMVILANGIIIFIKNRHSRTELIFSITRCFSVELCSLSPGTSALFLKAFVYLTLVNVSSKFDLIVDVIIGVEKKMYFQLPLHRVEQAHRDIEDNHYVGQLLIQAHWS